MTFAAFVVFGPRAAIPVTTASLLVTLRLDDIYGTDFPVSSLLLAGLLFSAAHAAAYGAGTFAFRRWAGTGVPRGVTVFLLVVPASALLAALGGAFSLAPVIAALRDVPGARATVSGLLCRRPAVE